MHAPHLVSMSEIRNVCVYCGSGLGADPLFAATARQLGALLAQHDVGLVYGGGSIGLMGEIATAAAEAGGRVVGVIPEFLMAKEGAVRLGEMVVTRDMHDRKRIMFERADAFIALPGGVGTLEELVEQLTWAQLGRHKKPILLFNVAGFWDPLCTLLDHMTAMQFIREGLSVTYMVEDQVERILPRLREAAAAISEEEKAMKVPLEKT